MIDGRRICVIIPAHNEARWIEEVLGTLPDCVDQAVVVDDASSDGTADKARNSTCAAVVEVLQLSPNRGVGGAIVAGYRHALRHGAEVLVVMAGDGQMAPADLVPLVNVALRSKGYVKGNRLAHPAVRQRMPALRWWGSRVLSRLTGWAVGQRIRDSQCGYTAIHRRGLERIDLARLWTGYGYPNDLLGLLAAAAVPIDEIPVEPRYRGEASGLRPRHFAVMLALIARAGVRRRRAHHLRKNAATAS